MVAAITTETLCHCHLCRLPVTTASATATSFQRLAANTLLRKAVSGRRDTILPFIDTTGHSLRLNPSNFTNLDKKGRSFSLSIYLFNERLIQHIPLHSGKGSKLALDIIKTDIEILHTYSAKFCAVDKQTYKILY